MTLASDLTTLQGDVTTAQNTLATVSTTLSSLSVSLSNAQAALTQAVADSQPVVTPPPVITPPPVTPNLPFATNGTPIWYTPIPTSPSLAPSSAAYVKEFAATPFPYGAITENDESWTPAVYETTGTDALVTVTDSNSSQQRVWQIPIPKGALPEAESDHELIVHNSTTGDVWEVWEFVWTGTTTATAASVAHSNTLTGNGTYQRIQGAGGTCAASGLSYYAGLIRPSEILSGIPHVILMGAPYSSGSFVSPALYADGNTKGGIPEGSRFFLPSTVAKPANLTQYASSIFTALQTYGAYLTDTSGSICFYNVNALSYTSLGQPDPWTAIRGGQQEYQLLSGLSGVWSQMEVLAVP